MMFPSSFSLACLDTIDMLELLIEHSIPFLFLKISLWPKNTLGDFCFRTLIFSLFDCDIDVEGLSSYMLLLP